MAFWTKIYNLWRQPIRKTALSFDKYIPYFIGDDNFPLLWHKIISESPSASSCVSTIQDFLEGAGFSDPELEKRVVNSKGETMFQIHQKTVLDFGEYEGFAWRFMFNAMGQVTSWEVLPFENCRLGIPDSNGFISKILYNPFFGTDDYQLKKDTIYYDAFNPASVKAQYAEQGNNYRGQVFYYGTVTALSRFYPIPAAYSAVKWMKIEAGVADYHEDNVNNGFLQPFMLGMIGDPNEPANNPEDGSPAQTKAEVFDEIVSQNFMGAKRVGNMWIHWVQNKEELPVPIAMPANNSSEQFISLDNQATKKITIVFKVPAILANINEGVSLGGDGNTVRVAVKLMQQRSIKKQRILTDSYETVLRAMDRPYVQPVTIAPYNPYPELEVIDDKIWQELKPEERRKWIEENTEIELMEEDLSTQPIIQPNPLARMSNAVPVQFPDAVRARIKKALAYQDKMDIKCGGRGGRDVAEAIMNNQNLGMRSLKRIHSYLKKRADLENSPFTDGCNVIEYNAWGGKDMEVFLEGKLKDLDAWLN